MFRQSGCICVVLTVVFSLPITAAAQGRCSARGIAGSWIVKCYGYLAPASSAPLLPATLLGKATADEHGNWSGSGGTLSIGGTIVTQDVKSVGPAQVNPDCTGNITYSQTIDGQAGPNIHFNFIIGKHNDVIDGIGTDPGTVFSCTLTKVND